MPPLRRAAIGETCLMRFRVVYPKNGSSRGASHVWKLSGKPEEEGEGAQTGENLNIAFFSTSEGIP